ncbi:hypothetical protein EVAR_83195_1 [Eumeta japonica]|uniref:Uncharacterized protein n=1 Tax=Eumeta variegata TaxID=151549 RepID=A0A4C1YU53_EUMVA|nr:hypothetical protein EVAR_83195_1 [Eumeta japonica]
MAVLRIPGAMRAHDGRDAGSLHAGGALPETISPDRQVFFLQTTTTTFFESGSKSTNVENVPNELHPLRWAASLLLLASSPSAAAPPVPPSAATAGAIALAVLVGTTMLFSDIDPGTYRNGRRYLAPVIDYHLRSAALP